MRHLETAGEMKLPKRTMHGRSAPIMLVLRRSLLLAVAAPALLSPAVAHAQDASDPAAPSARTAPAATAPPAKPAPEDDAHDGALLPTRAPASSAVPPPSSDISVTAAPTIDPARDARSLATQGGDRPGTDPRGSAGTVGEMPSEVYSEDWWSHTRPIVELHGYFRTRAELFHNFALGRHGDANSVQNLWPQPVDNAYFNKSGSLIGPSVCGTGANEQCQDKSQASANLRFRIEPEIHISDNLRIRSQIDALDNLVLGSTPDTFNLVNGAKNPYAPLNAGATTETPPTAGVNGYRNSIDVKRVWAEYQTPVGQLRFGRMPSQWGLGMVQNAGDGIDSDYQTTLDRIMFVTGIKSMDLYFGGAWDFIATGPTSATPYSVNGGQPYNTANNSNVAEWALFAAHKTNPELQRHALSRGEVVINGGLYATYRAQILDTPLSGTTSNPYAFQDATTSNINSSANLLQHRGAYAFTPDPWLQILWRKFRFEAEFAAVWGFIDQPTDGTGSAAATTAQSTKIRQFGLATQTEFKAVEDKLRLQFGFGWASGNQWASSLNPGGTSPTQGTNPLSTFAFHPDYRVDLIFFRNILSRVEGAYYFRPSVEYDFLRNANGQKLGGNAAIIWSRASEFEQAPGHKRDLGVELDASIYYQAKDGSLNDNPDKLGGFYAMLQYGVFFPLGGLGYLPGEQTPTLPSGETWDLTAAQTVRLFLGVAY